MGHYNLNRAGLLSFYRHLEAYMKSLFSWLPFTSKHILWTVKTTIMIIMIIPSSKQQQQKEEKIIKRKNKRKFNSRNRQLQFKKWISSEKKINISRTTIIRIQNYKPTIIQPVLLDLKTKSNRSSLLITKRKRINSIN